MQNVEHDSVFVQVKKLISTNPQLKMSEEMFYLSYFDFELHKPQEHKKLFPASGNTLKFIFLVS